MAIIQPTIQNTGEWTPPSDWIQLPAVANNEILLLVSDINPYYAFNVTVTGGYTVDWGDGTVTNHASNTDATHTYTVGTGKYCSRGYTTWKVRIYAQTPANSIIYFNVQQSNSIRSQSNSILWAKLGTQGILNLNYSFYNSTSNRLSISYYLECVELPYSFTNSSAYQHTFDNCYSLQKVVMPYVYYTGGNIVMNHIFNNCYSLKSIDYHASTLNVSTFASAHQNNYALKSVKLPDTVNGCTNWNSMFENSGIVNVSLPIINTNCSTFSMFSTCLSLKKIEFPQSWSGKISDLSYLSRYNTNIEIIILPELVGSLANTGIDQLCIQNIKLRTLTLPTNIPVNFTQIWYIFQGCFNLESIHNFPIASSVELFGNLFQNCYKLKNIYDVNGNLYDFGAYFGNTTTGFDHTNTFAGCYSLNPVGGLKNRNKITGRFVLKGVDSSNLAALQALLFTNPAAVSTWAGASPQIDVAFCSMDATALNALFTSIIATSASFSGKTIRITGNPGAATCDTTIITNAGGTVNKTT